MRAALNLLYAKWIEEAEHEAERRRRARIGGTPKEAMIGVLQEVERRYGGVPGYLTAAGAGRRTQSAIRSRLRMEDKT